MVRQELIKNSPLRILEKSTHGGVGKGNIGLIAACKGVGKTACLVHIATDQLFQNKHVIHVSFASNTEHIISWYEDIFQEIAKRRDLENAMDVHDEIIKNRVIMNFNPKGVSVKQVINSLKAMIRDGSFAANCVIVDGYDFTKGSVAEIELFKQFTEELNLELWFSATIKKEDSIFESNKIPQFLQDYLKHIAIIIILKPIDGIIQLELVKDHDITPVDNMHLKLDCKTLLISRENI